MKTSLIAIFALEVLFFIGSMLIIFAFKALRKPLILFSPLIATGVLGAALFVLTIKYQMTGTLRVFLMLVGAAPGAMFISIVLHNLISGLIMKIIRKDFEEAVFFLLAIFGCPAAFLVGTVGTIVLMIKNAVAR